MIATQTQIHTAVTLHRVLSGEHVARRRPGLVPRESLPGRQYGVVLRSERSDDLSLPSEAQHELP